MGSFISLCTQLAIVSFVIMVWTVIGFLVLTTILVVGSICVFVFSFVCVYIYDFVYGLVCGNAPTVTRSDRVSDKKTVKRIKKIQKKIDKLFL